MLLPTVLATPSNSIIFGFDSAWAGESPGAICAISFDDHGDAVFNPPELVSFDEALCYINKHKQLYVRTVVAMDQPIIVPNPSGMRPVERLAGSVLGYTGGGVQPANTANANMFGPEAPIWEFKKSLGANEDPERARDTDCGLFLMEVFPALALPGLHAPFAGRYRAPKYNPGKPSTFCISDWDAVVEVVVQTAHDLQLEPCANWCKKFLAASNPQKSDQDKLDSVMCVLIGCIWLAHDRSCSMLLGDLETGYMVTPVSCETAGRLSVAADEKGVPCS